MSVRLALWILLPLFLLLAWTAFEYIADPQTVADAVAENGLIEIAQVFAISIGLFAALVKLRHLDWREQKFLVFWFSMASLGCLYIAGEEISWGQWVLLWESSDFWLAINDQNETNLHNTSSWLDQKPRILLEIGVVVSGLILVWLRKRHPQKIPAWLMPLIPASPAACVAGLYVFVKLTDVVWNVFEIKLYARASEVIEFLIYYYITVYVIDFDTKTTRKA